MTLSLTPTLLPLQELELFQQSQSTSPGGISKRGSHRIATVGHCHRKWWYRFIVGLTPKSEFIYFVEGRLIHIALAYFRAIQMHQRGKQAPAWYYARPNGVEVIREAGRGYPQAIDLALAVYVAYHNYYGEDLGWEPMAIEHEFFATLGQIRKLVNPTHVIGERPDDAEVFSARIDLMVKSNGYYWAVDYKSTKHVNAKGGLPDFNPEGEFKLHWQFLLQTAILRVNLGTDFRGVIVERIAKKPPYAFMRSPVPISRAAFLSLPHTLARRAREEAELMADAEAVERNQVDLLDALPDGDFWSCFSYGKPCEYRQICTADDAGQVRDIVVREYHRE